MKTINLSSSFKETIKADFFSLKPAFMETIKKDLFYIISFSVVTGLSCVGMCFMVTLFIHNNGQVCFKIIDGLKSNPFYFCKVLVGIFAAFLMMKVTDNTKYLQTILIVCIVVFFLFT